MKADILKKRADYEVDLRTNFHRGGHDPVASNVVFREVLKNIKLRKNDHFFYKWHYQLIQDKHKLQFNIPTATELTVEEIIVILDLIKTTVTDLFNIIKHKGPMIVFNRLQGKGHEETRILLGITREGYLRFEKEALSQILKELKKHNVNIAIKERR